MPAISFRKQLEGIPPYIPGMPDHEAKRRYNLESVIKLASNECPLGPFPSVISKMPQWVVELGRYPDTDCHELLTELAMVLARPKEEILVGNGSSDIVARVATALLEPGDEVIIAWPTFPLYEILATLAGAAVRRIPLRSDYRHDLEQMLGAINPRTKLVVVCNPNNPTGTYVPEADFIGFLDYVPRNVLVIADEAYFEYCAAHDFETMLPQVRKYENLLVARTFSKIYGLAGLRVGYGVVSREVADNLRKAQTPFTVNTLAQRAALESLHHPELVGERKALNLEWKSTLCAALSSLGYSSVKSEANFVMTRLGENSASLFTEFVRRGVILRPASPNGWMRITVGTPDENQKFLEVLAEIDSLGRTRKDAI